MVKKFLLLAAISYMLSGINGLEAKDATGDVGLNGKPVDYPNADLIYASVAEENNKTIFTAKVAGRMKENVYCEFDVGNIMIYYKGGKIFEYVGVEGGIINASYEINKNYLKIVIPKIYRNISDISVRLDMQAKNGWYIDKIPNENFRPIEKRKEGGFEFISILFIIFVAMFLKRIKS
ncbi:MAG: hypothetical protein J7J36_03190 [Thermoplasmata archaeon]|nr:hypothetical protein [Thermoplasmata archaeon]